MTGMRVALCLAAGLWAATAAQAQTVHDGLTVDEFATIVTSSGLEHVRRDRDEGVAFEITTADGYRYEAAIAECEGEAEKRCISLNLWSFNFNESPTVTLKGVNKFNNESWGVRAMLFADGQSGLNMSIGLNGGVTDAWVKNRFANFGYWLKVYGDFHAGRAPAPAPTGEPAAPPPPEATTP